MWELKRKHRNKMRIRKRENTTRKTVAESPDLSSGTTPVGGGASQRGEVLNNREMIKN
jgi:hypothetical protein